jgi:hypothetical protein
MHTPPDLHRALPRLPGSLRVHLQDGWSGDVVNLSATGLRIRALLELPVGTPFEGELEAEDGRLIPLKGRVVWSRPADFAYAQPAEAGLLLEDVPQAYGELVAELFARGD